jgi:hypothetical protein
MIDYERIAMDAGYTVKERLFNGSVYYCYHAYGKWGFFYSTEQEAWKACCVENGLVEGLEGRL